MSHPTSAYEPYTFFFSEKIPGTQIHLVAQLQKYNFTITVCCREFSSSLSVDTVLVWAVFQSSVSSDEVNAVADIEFKVSVLSLICSVKTQLSLLIISSKSGDTSG